MGTPRVSVVLVNFRGADDTLAAIEGLRAVDWPQELLEIVVVENGSGDESGDRIETAAPDVVLVRSPANLGFAGGCNLGVSRSTGEIVAFLNSDARPDRRWVAAAVEEFGRSPKVGAVASRVLDWEGEHVDFVGAALTWFGMGFKPFTGEPASAHEEPAHDVLFGTGSAMFVRRGVFEALGGFDERYFMFFEDVDLGWRLNLAGWRYRYVPESLAFHRHHASVGKLGAFRETYLLERNALFTLYKNLERPTLDRLLPAAMALSARRAVARGGLDAGAFEMTRADLAIEDPSPVPNEALAALYAQDGFVTALPGLGADRRRIQESRVVSDAAMWHLFGDLDSPSLQAPSYLDGYMDIATEFDVLTPPERTAVLVVTGDPLGARLAGPAIRAWNIAAALTEVADVTLVSLSGVAEGLEAPFRLAHVPVGADRAMRPWEEWADVIVFQGHALDVFPSLRATRKIVVADVYDPMHLEQLEQARHEPEPVWTERVASAAASLNAQLIRADFLLCASERQRQLYLGQLGGLGRLTPELYRDDPLLSGLLAVVPFGLDAVPPRHERDVLKGVLPGIGTDDKVVLWSGGLYDWFDPETLVIAMKLLDDRRPGVRLFFQGTAHPHPGVPEMPVVARTRELADRLGLLDRVVFLNSSWVEYADRQNYLLEADAGVSTHHVHVETTFSFRTRILDYLWAGLPMVVTEGDVFAELVAAETLGVVVPEDDPEALADALERVLFDQDFAAEVRASIARVRDRFEWGRVLEPLVDFVRNPRPAADRRSGSVKRTARVAPVRRSGPAYLVSRAGFYLRNGGVRVVAGKVFARLRG